MNRSKSLVSMSALAAMALATLAGCRHERGPRAEAPQADAVSQLRGGPSEFDTEKEPPIRPNTLFAAGQLAESQNNLSVALRRYEETLKDDPHHTGAMYRAGVLYAQLRQYPRAIEMWSRYVRETNGSATGYGNLGFCYELAGEDGRAEEAYQKGVAGDPHDQPCRVNYGLMLARQGRINEATRQLRSVLTPAEVCYNIASVYEQQGKKDEARVEYHKALKLDPSLKDAEMRLAALQ